MNPKILVVDDEFPALQATTEILGDHGFAVTGVQTREAAQQALSTQGPWDVVVLDEFLRGPAGAATATELLAEIAVRAPEARTIVLSGYARPDLVRTAIAAGAWDYLEKSASFLPLLLPLRVSNAVEAARERRLRKVEPSALEGELRATWAQALGADLDANQKGLLLEHTIELLFRTIPGLNEVSTRRGGSSEEIDVVVENGATDPILSKEGSYILVECKNWSRPVGPPELEVFRAKLRDRHERVRLGLLIGISGFTEGVRTKLERWTNEPQTVLLLARSDLDAWINADNRLGWLKQRLQQAILREQAS